MGPTPPQVPANTADGGSDRPKPGLPSTDMKASPEVQAWLARLEAESGQIGTRNKYLAVALGVGILLLLIILWELYRATIGAYAVIDNIKITPHPIHQGQLQIEFEVVRPGRVYCRRTSGQIETDLIDHFAVPCRVSRPWAWGYQPGRDIDITLWYRGGPFRQTYKESFSTYDMADIVVLMDTTGSMSPSIAALKTKCVVFSEKLRKRALKHRFALVGFGDAQEGTWLDRHAFTDDVNRFVDSVTNVERFDGGDLPESALDALEAALELPLDERALRRFYLVTDAKFHEPARSGATAAQIAVKLEKQRVLLRVFSKPEFEADYAKLLGEMGRFQDIENFGRVLSQGRVLGE